MSKKTSPLDVLPLLHALKGAPASVMLALYFANRPVGASELAETSGWSARKITQALRKLRSLGLAQNQARYNGWTLTPSGNALLENPRHEKSGETSPRGRNYASESVGVNLTPVKVFTPPDSDSAEQDEFYPSANGVFASPGAACLDTGRILAATEELFGERVHCPPNYYPDASYLLAWIAHVYHHRRSFRKPARVVYANLKLRNQPQGKFRQNAPDYLPKWFLCQAGVIPPEEADLEEEQDAASEADSPPEDDLPLHPSLNLPVNAAGSRTAAQAWETAINQLRQEMPKAAYQTHLEPSRLARYDPEAGCFTVAAPTDFSRAWLVDHLTSTLVRMLAGICNRTATVEFVCPPKTIASVNPSDA